VCVLRLNTLEWHEVKFRSDRHLIDPPRLYNFSSCICGDELIMFGGMGDKYFLSKNLYCMQLDHIRTEFVPPPKENDPLIFNGEISNLGSPNKQKEEENSEDECW